MTIVAALFDFSKQVRELVVQRQLDSNARKSFNITSRPSRESVGGLAFSGSFGRSLDCTVKLNTDSKLFQCYFRNLFPLCWTGAREEKKAPDMPRKCCRKCCRGKRRRRAAAARLLPPLALGRNLRDPGDPGDPSVAGANFTVYNDTNVTGEVAVIPDSLVPNTAFVRLLPGTNRTTSVNSLVGWAEGRYIGHDFRWTVRYRLCLGGARIHLRSYQPAEVGPTLYYLDIVPGRCPGGGGG